MLAENAGRWEAASPRDLARIEAIARAVMTRLLHEPTIRLRSLEDGRRARAHASLELVRELFALRDDEASEHPEGRPQSGEGAQAAGGLAEVHDLERRRADPARRKPADADRHPAQRARARAGRARRRDARRCRDRPDRDRRRRRRRAAGQVALGGRARAGAARRAGRPRRALRQGRAGRARAGPRAARRARARGRRGRALRRGRPRRARARGARRHEQPAPGRPAAGARADLEVVPLRGNVDTRLAKLATTSGSTRSCSRAPGCSGSGARRRPARCSTRRFVPAPGQGALALEGRAGDEAAGEAAAGAHRRPAACRAARRARARARARRRLPHAARRARSRERGRRPAAARLGRAAGRLGLGRRRAGGRARPPEELGARVAARLRAVGAAELLEGAREMAGDAG